MVEKGGACQRLLSYFSIREHAVFIGQEIERYLGIGIR
jgi:hypothetical protein